ncbi:hypothetical protein WR25_19835 [Diploscapter pachys]|uniref:Reverse transcriptase domain-containing protein n=1 Tax=Diploscapter pachys TaxID=2018661 RepID=A0A2A2JLL3_9BILA|nr:hypothetical protein WR25_19835 [Diploscapter pachys]
MPVRRTNPSAPTCWLPVPFDPPYPCQPCLPIPRSYTDHGGLSRHLRQQHDVNVGFECRNCGLQDELKKVNLHIKKTPACAAAANAFTTARAQAASAAPAAPAPRAIRIRNANNPPAGRPAQAAPPSSPSSSSSSSSSPSSSSSSSSSSQYATPQPTPRRPRRHATHPIAQPVQSSDSSSDSSNNTTAAPQPPATPPLAASTPVPLPVPVPTPPPIPSLFARPVHSSQSRMSAAQEEWTDRFDNNTSTAAELEAATDELIAAVQELLSSEERRAAAARQRTQRPPAPTRQHTPQSVTEERTRIQRLWRTNRKRAFREVTGDSSPGCTIDKADVESHFKQIHAVGSSLNPTPTPIPDPLPLPTNRNPLQPPFTSDEVWERLRRSSDTAPGPDALRYSHWRRFDPHSHILAAAFNAVHRLSHAPSNWKTSTTVLLHKKGDKADIGNWRPIALASTMGKLYSACLARRLLTWSSAHQRLSPAQKGFISVPGCTEHNFTLQTVIADARRHRRNIAVAWLDLANAFGSLPHSALFDALEWTGLDQTAIGRIRELYTGTTTSVRTATGTTAPIPVEAGVLQGSPLSPILFNLAIEPMLRAAQKSSAGYSLYGHSVSVLAYADDVALIASDATDLQNALNDVSAAADRAGLRFKPAKCASLHFTKGKPKLTTFHVQGGRMPALEKFDAYTHLGVPTVVHSIASQSSREVAEKKVQRAVTDDEMRDYYNGSTEGVFDTNSTDVASVWTRARMATRRLRNLTNVSWACTNGQLSLRIDDQTAAPGTTQHLLRRALWIHELQSLLEKPDQGRASCAPTSPSSTTPPSPAQSSTSW